MVRPKMASSPSCVSSVARKDPYAAIDRAIRAAGGQLPVRGNVISQLSATSGFAGTTGPIGFDVAGDTTNRVLSVTAPARPRRGSSQAWLITAIRYLFDSVLDSRPIVT